MSVSPLERPSRRVEIAETALRLIATRGIAALTTTALAEELGVTSGALFRHFASRDAILEEVVSRVEALFTADFPSGELPPKARLEQFMRQRAATASRQAGVLRLMISEQFALALPAAAALRLLRLVHATQAYIVSTLREGVERGQFRQDVDPLALSIMVMGSMQMLAVMRHLQLEGLDGERAAAIVDGVLALVSAPQTGEA